MAALGEVTQSVSTWNPKKGPEATFNYVDLSAVDNMVKQVTHSTIVQSEEAPSRARQLIAAGDILVSTVRPNLNAVATVPASLDGATASTGFSILRPTEAVHRRYLFHWVRTPLFIDDMVRKATGASYPAVSDRIVKESKMPLPVLDEQRRIAAILDHADALCAKRRQVLAHLDDITQSIFDDMFGEATRSDRWRVVKIVDIAMERKNAIADGPFGSALKPHDYRGQGVPVIRIKNVTKGGEFLPEGLLYIDREKFESLQRSALTPGDVIVTRVGTLGNTCIFPDGIGDALLSTTGVCKITPDPSQIMSEYLHQAIRTPAFQRQIERSASSSVQRYFNLTALKNWTIAVPPLRYQAEFVAHLTLIQEQRQLVQEATNAEEELFAALQSRAFRGEL